MISAISSFLRCPACCSIPLQSDRGGVFCPACGNHYPLRDGILDMAPSGTAEVITPFQRIMQTPLVVSVYESVWRRIGYFLASARPFGRELSTVLEMNRGRESSRLLDLACGPGVFTRPLAVQSGGIVVGLDLSWPMLRYAIRKIQHEGIQNIILIRGSAFRLPFVDGTFTYINCCGALHLFDRPAAALAEIERVLAGAGHLSVQTTIRPRSSAGLAWFLERFIRFGFFARRDLEEQIRDHHLEIIASERHRISYTFLARRIS